MDRWKQFVTLVAVLAFLGGVFDFFVLYPGHRRLFGTISEAEPEPPFPGPASLVVERMHREGVMWRIPKEDWTLPWDPVPKEEWLAPDQTPFDSSGQDCPPPQDLPPCSWSNVTRPLPPSTHAHEARLVKMIRFLNCAKIRYFLVDGALLGAFRHGGPIPGDDDLDVRFNVWLNGLANCTDAFTPTPTLGSNSNSELTLCGETQREHKFKLIKLLKKKAKLLGVSMAMRDTSPRWGFKMSGLAPVDAVVRIKPDKQFVQHGPVCRCRWNGIWAMCLEGAADVLESDYGPSYMTPLRNSSRQ